MLLLSIVFFGMVGDEKVLWGGVFQGGLDQFGLEVVFVGIGDVYVDFVVWFQFVVVDEYVVVDFWSVGLGVVDCVLFVDFVDQYFDFFVYFELQVSGGNCLLVGYEVFLVVLFDFVWYWFQVQFVGWSVFDGGVLEVVDVVELGFCQLVEQVLEVFFGFVWEVDDEG